MGDFGSDWLALREPADHAARAHALLDELPSRTDGAPTRIVDLGTGTGSNLRYLLPRLGPRQHWRLIDNDPELLADLSPRLTAWASDAGLRTGVDADGLRLEGANVRASITTQALDLAGELDALRLRNVDLVTCSALLDLFSVERLQALADALAAARCSALFALSYDGRVAWHPHLPFDERATALLNAHQRRDKGLGGAAGPDAGEAVVAALQARDYRVISRQADWLLDTSGADLQGELIDGWMQAAIEQEPSARTDITDWHRQRRRLIDTGTGTLRVGHLDLVAIPG